MILRDVVCRTPRCEQEGELIEIIVDREATAYCAGCGKPMENQITTGKAILFKEGWYENIDADPMYISSMRQLKYECEKRNLTSVYAHEM